MILHTSIPQEIKHEAMDSRRSIDSGPLPQRDAERKWLGFPRTWWKTRKSAELPLLVFFSYLACPENTRYEKVCYLVRMSYIFEGISAVYMIVVISCIHLGASADFFFCPSCTRAFCSFALSFSNRDIASADTSLLSVLRSSCQE